MPTLIAGIVAVALLYMALNVIKGADPKWLAKIIRGGGGVLTLAAAAFVGAKGELAVAIPLAVFGAGLLGWSPFGAQLGSAWGNYGPQAWKSKGQKSEVRSQFVEMTLDHDTGTPERTERGRDRRLRQPRQAPDFRGAQASPLAQRLDDPARRRT